MDKNFIARNVAERLFATEDAVDTAIAETSQLLNEMLTARKQLGAAAAVGNGAATKVAEAIAALSQARTAMVDAHNELGDVQEKLGVRVRSLYKQTASAPVSAPEYREAV
jgi:hypothetical protein